MQWFQRELCLDMSQSGARWTPVSQTFKGFLGARWTSQALPTGLHPAKQLWAVPQARFGGFWQRYVRRRVAIADRGAGSFS